MANAIDKYLIDYGSPVIRDHKCGKITGMDFVKAGKEYGNHPYFIVAIARADSSLGKGLTNRCNLGNTGHCDSCRWGNQYTSFRASIYSISQTVSNKYLGKGTKSCHFSVGGWKHCAEGRTINNGKFYASSKENWNKNVNNTLSKLFNTNYRNDFYIKL